MSSIVFIELDPGMVLAPSPPSMSTGLFHGYKCLQSDVYLKREAEYIPAALVTAEEGPA